MGIRQGGADEWEKEKDKEERRKITHSGATIM
jgi:hypothetical protein